MMGLGQCWDEENGEVDDVWAVVWLQDRSVCHVVDVGEFDKRSKHCH